MCPSDSFLRSISNTGEILQKFSNYRMRLAVVGDFAVHVSSSLKAFIAESNRGAQIAFVADREAALERL